MSPAISARALVFARDGGMAVPRFSPIALIGVALGGAGFLVLVSVGVMHFRYVRHKRKMETERRRQVTNNAPNITANPLDVPRPQAIFCHGLHLSGHGAPAWQGLPSQENLQPNSASTKRRTEKRTSELLSWPLPRRRSKRASTPKISRPSLLSAIPESPGSQMRSSDNPECSTGNGAAGALMPVELDSTSIFNISKGSEEDQAASGTQNPSLAVSSSDPTNPGPLSSNEQSHPTEVVHTRSHAHRSISGPCLLTSKAKEESNQSIPQASSEQNHSRSFSLGTQEATSAPTIKLPPLPDSIQHKCGTELTDTTERHVSTSSTSSIESMGTSILNSPNSKASVDFSRRHPELGLGIQVREGETELKSSLMAGPNQARVRSKITNSPRLLSSVASLRIASARNSIELKRLSSSGKYPGIKSPRHSSIGTMQPDQRGRLSCPSSRASQIDNSTSVITTPNRKPFKRKISDGFGSPMERRRNSILKHTNRRGSMPSREISQTSTQTTASSVSPGNPFQWDSPDVSTKRSSTRMSPVSKKTHKRQSSIRTSIPPAILCPPSRSTSSSKMLQIAEESNETSLETHLRSPPPNSNQLCSNRLEPILKNQTVYRASLTSRSPTLSLLQYEHYCGNEDSVQNETSRRDVSPTKVESARESNASSVVIPVFPDPGKFKTSHHDPKKHHTWESKPMSSDDITSSPLSSSPRQTLPGLTLLEDSTSKVQELEFPTIELVASPRAESPRGKADSPVLPNPPSPWPVKEQISSSPPIPRSLSPPLKSRATTQLSQELPPIPSQRITPLSSIISPMNTKPNFLPPEAGPSMWMRYDAHPNGPRAAPAPDVLGTAKALRRMNTEYEMAGSWEARRYFRIGRDMGPDPSLCNMAMSTTPLEDEGLGEEEKENERYRGGALEDADDFWNTNTGSDSRERGFEAQIVAQSKPKKVAWGGVDVKETTPGSMASDGGVSFGEEDFF